MRCPKCRAPLPSRRPQTVAGGTAVEGGGRVPLLPIAGGAIIVLAVILYVVLGKSDAAKSSAPDPATVTSTEPTAEAPQSMNPGPLPVLPERDNNRIDPSAVGRDLERALKNQRLWSSVEVADGDVDIRSGSCRDENMIPIVDAARTALRNAGLTRVRCMENSGAVVFERGL